MQIVIDIPKGAYEEICRARFPLQDAYRIVAWIKNGTPLPKGHGRLIDADVFESRCMFGSDIEGMEDVIYVLSGCKSIIEEDTESEEEIC